MKNRFIVLNLLLSGMLVLGFSFVGCGGDGGGDQEQAGDQEQSSGTASESGANGGSSGGASSGDIQEQIAAAVEGVQTKEDAEKVDAKLGELYGKLYDALKNEMNNPGDAAWATENSRQSQAASERLGKHMETLGRERPDVAMLLGASIAKNGMKVAGLAMEALKKVDPKDMEKMQKAMEDVRKKVEEGK